MVANVATKGARVRVLLIEDDPRQASSLLRGLTGDGFVVDVAGDGSTGLAIALASEVDVVVLDLMLPGMNGFEVCRRLRDADVWAPILVLTAKTGEYDEIEALDTGADDFLMKPFSYEVLLARLRALLRRGVRERPAILTVGSLQLDPATRVCRRGDAAVSLTPREFSVLEYLMHHAGRVVTKDELLDHVWGVDFVGSANIAEVYVSYLRKKIDRPFEVVTIETVAGVGYRLVRDG